MKHWLFGLAAWVVQDENYGDFVSEQEIDFAIELTPKRRPSHAGRGPPFRLAQARALARREASAAIPEAAIRGFDLESGVVYDLVARVIARHEGVAALDCGLGVYCTFDPVAGAELGATLAVTGSLDVDPFTYFEQLAHNDSLPPLIYRWRVERIGRQLAPLREDEPGSFVRDEAEFAFAPVEATNAWEDDGGHASHVLECVRLDEPPRRKRELHG